jgi:hypothetical protein
MSLSNFRHPLEIVSHPQFEPEVKRAILASWASDAGAVHGQAGRAKQHRLRRPAPSDEGRSAPRNRGQGES